MKRTPSPLRVRLTFTKWTLALCFTARGEYGTVLTLSTRKWLNPGERVWSVSLARRRPALYRSWRSAWQRPVHYVGMKPAYWPWQAADRNSRSTQRRPDRKP